MKSHKSSTQETKTKLHQMNTSVKSIHTKEEYHKKDEISDRF